MTSWLPQTQFIKSLANNLLQSKHTHYHEEYLKHKLIQCNLYTCCNFYVRNCFGERLKVSVIRGHDDGDRERERGKEREKERDRDWEREDCRYQEWQNERNKQRISLRPNSRQPVYPKPQSQPTQSSPNQSYIQSHTQSYTKSHKKFSPNQSYHFPQSPIPTFCPTFSPNPSSPYPPTPESPKTCIIYLHGFGSHRLQGITILSTLNTLSKNWNLCCFDFSGSGKSQGQVSTYGIKEYLDIQAVMDVLRGRFGYRRFVLWGRSMGATASLLYTCSPNTRKDDILFQVLDSPFISFQKIAKHHATTSYHLPQLFLTFGLNLLKQQYKTHEHNPFKIDLAQTLQKCKTPALFVYCEKDTIIPAENSIEIIGNLNEELLYQRLIIQENHNTFRSADTLRRIMEIVRKYVGENRVKEKVKYRRGIGEILSGSLTPTLSSTNEVKIKKLSGLHGNCSRNKLKEKKMQMKEIPRCNPEEGKELSYGDFFRSCRNCTKVEKD